MPLSTVLGAQSLVQPAVCTTATRPASPYTGQAIYDTTVATTLVWSGSAWIASGGKVLQVVQALYATSTSTTSTSYVTTGLSASITPTSNTSKVMIMYTGFMFISPAAKLGRFTIFRGTVAGTNLASAPGLGCMYSSSTDLMNNTAMQFLDSPSTTSATTYTIGMNTDSGTIEAQRYSTQSVIILMEISA